MKVSDTIIPDVKIIEPKIFKDNRGIFFESFHQRRFTEVLGYDINFVQDNHSKSVKGVLRGLHYQLPPRAQGKLIRVIQGEIFDVAIDLRRSSPTFGQWISERLSADNKKQLWMPIGFAHGFLTLSDTAEVVYKTTDYYDINCERSIRWDDALLNIKWPNHSMMIVSAKDNQAASLIDSETFQ